MNPTAVVDQTFGNGSLTPSLKVLLVLTVLALLPAIILTMTSFVRTVVVLSFVRQGVGTQVPPNQVVIGLALFLTLFTMSPVVDSMKTAAYDPYMRGEVTDMQALELASVPLKKFMLRETREADLRMFYSVTKTPLPATPEDVPMRLAAPAFVVSELTTAFQMGVIILLPFLVVDLAVASLLMSMGMMMVPPTTLSLPIKLLLFVLVDGWSLVAGSLMRSFW
ncbi:MAG: flagellar type III secretion system pore protein FliP [Polyangiaceae bacterium]|jgi:flagellar biosynthetic protein FliP|nr:flagellar type III secretion system pore protein FliP [Polyangiaceae bacterium]MCK6532605.1 flagellar type III secretion system pore protein FliP [Polyangiaceae bacterium]